jgi:hypothetical protein
VSEGFVMFYYAICGVHNFLFHSYVLQLHKSSSVMDKIYAEITVL